MDEVIGANVADIEKKLHKHSSSAGTASFAGTGRSLGSGASVAGTAGSTANGNHWTSTNIFIMLTVVYLLYKILYKAVGV